MTTIRAHFDGRVFVPDEPVDVPKDTPLQLQVAPADNPAAPSDQLDYSPFADLLKDLEPLPDNPDAPRDRAAQHDHYLYGVPKDPENQFRP